MEDKYLPYRGNTRLKRTGVAIEWTEERISEYVKCAEDPVYFTENYMRIINVDDGLVSFNLYDYQKDILRSFKDNRFTIITTARQAGKSTTTCAFILWYILFHSEKVVALLANKADVAREILGRVQLAYQYLPQWLQHGVKEWNKGSFVLENDSRVLAAATSSDSIRGYSINFLFIDECAHIENWDEFYTSTFPTISSGKTTKIGLVSTPCGLNHFYEIWENANKRSDGEHLGKNGFYPIKVMWQQVPGRDEKWKEMTLAGMNFNYEKFRQEYENEFLGSSGTLIAGWKLQELKEAKRDPDILDKKLKMYIAPQKKHIYFCTVDVSRGKGLDYSAFSIVDVTEMPFKQVCVYRDNMITPLDFAEKILHVCKSYNNAHVMVEINDIGGQVADSLWFDYEYEYIIYTQNSGRAGKKITDSLSDKNDRGCRTTKSVKSLGCILLKLLIEQQKLEIWDNDTIWELSRFSKKNDSMNNPTYEAEEGATDDLTMTLVLFAWASDQQFVKELNDINTLQHLKDQTEEDLALEMAPFGFYQDGTEEYDEYEIERPSIPHWIFAEEWE